MWSGQPLAVFAIFLVAQVLDGSLTYWGVNRLGTQVELNVLIATAIHALGPGPAIVGAKVLAAVCGLILHVTRSHRSLAVATGTYIGVAVVPWLLVLALFA